MSQGHIPGSLIDFLLAAFNTPIREAHEIVTWEYLETMTAVGKDLSFSYKYTTTNFHIRGSYS